MITKERIEELKAAAEHMEAHYGINNAVLSLTTEEFLAIYNLIDFSKLGLTTR